MTSTSLTVCCWLWRQPAYRRTFTAMHVNTLRAMVDRNLTTPHQWICFTDQPKGIDSAVQTLPLPKSPPVKLHPRKPNCFRRLWAFSDEARSTLGERFVSFDLDCVVTGPLDPLVDRPDDFVIWGDTARRTLYNGSMWLMTAGARRQVWEDFNPQKAQSQIMAAHMIGSDQAWISLKLGPGQAKWTQADGVYSFRNDIQRKNRGRLPANARIVFFHGVPDPWDPSAQREYPWIKEHYR